MCSLHFEKRMYGRKILKKIAVPTLQLPTDYGSDSKPDPIVKTDVIYVFRDRSPIRCASMERDLRTPAKLNERSRRKRKLFLQSIRASKKLKLIDETDEHVTDTKFLNLCDTFLSPKLSAIAKVQIYLRPHCKNNKYSRELKSFCLRLYYKSPLAYRFLSKTISLPSKSNLAYTYFQVQTKSEEMWDILTATVKHMSSFEKECVLCMDTMRLKMNLCYSTKEDRILGLHEVDGAQQPVAARFALTLMVRGITSTWKQLIGFSFISNNKVDDPTKTWIFRTVRRLLHLGLNVRAVVSDLGSNFWAFSKSLGITQDIFFFRIDDRKIYYIYNVPNLMKCLRNSLMKYNFKFDGRVVRWENIISVYENDKSQNVRLAPRLTDSHVQPNRFQKRIVRYAVQVFSNSVAEMLKMYKPSESLQTAKGTLHFVQIVNDLFDLLNSSNTGSSRGCSKPYKGTTDQEELLEKAQQMFSDMMFKNKKNDGVVTGGVKFVNAFNVTINSIRQLYNDMKSEGHDHIFTRNINNDCLENFFALVRRDAGNSGLPTCLRYTRIFRKVFLFQILNLSDATNRTDDFDHTLSQLIEFSKDTPRAQTSRRDPLHIKPKKYLLKEYDIPEKNGAYYLCGYLLRRCVERHTRDCLSVIDLHIRLKTYDTCRDSLQGLQVLPSGFVHYVYRLEKAFTSNFASFTGNNVGAELFRNMSTIEFLNKPCECFPKYFLLKLFIRIRIFHTVKVNNINFKSSKCKTRKYLSVPFIIN